MRQTRASAGRGPSDGKRAIDKRSQGIPYPVLEEPTDTPPKTFDDGNAALQPPSINSSPRFMRLDAVAAAVRIVDVAVTQLAVWVFYHWSEYP